MLSIMNMFSETSKGLDIFEYYLPGIKSRVGNSISFYCGKELKPYYSIYFSTKTEEYRFVDFDHLISLNIFFFVRIIEGLKSDFESHKYIEKLIRNKEKSQSWISAEGDLVFDSKVSKDQEYKPKPLLNSLIKSLSDSVEDDPIKLFTQLEVVEMFNKDATWFCKMEDKKLLVPIKKGSSIKYNVGDVISIIENPKLLQSC